ncbi:MAG: ADP-ribosylation factor-like protein [Candidatus Helarchaeota archaeon]
MTTAKKISLVGTAGVGKTTLMKMLSDKNIPNNHQPTIAVDFTNIDINGYNISMWELGGQQQFQFMWDDFIKGSNFICIVSDSTKQNIEESKRIIEHFKHLKKNMMIIANKQDMSNALSPTKIQELLGIETFGMVAIDKTKKQMLLKILEEKMNLL